eukprot:1785405-Rhodomonas_salina.2
MWRWLSLLPVTPQHTLPQCVHGTFSQPWHILTCWRRGVQVYKAAGVAIPVSGIKTRDSTGIGEFLDLKMVVDWCTKTGLQLIQILPINDSGEDPSPYRCISTSRLPVPDVRC